MEHIKGLLHTHYGKLVRQEVRLMVPYSRQKQFYATEFQKLREQGWTEEELPELSTIDGSIGQEKNDVLFDVVVTRGGSDLGFLTDNQRACVAFTRSKKATWAYAGTLNEPNTRRKSDRWNRRVDTDGNRKPAYAIMYYRDYLKRADCAIWLDPPSFEYTDTPLDLWSEAQYADYVDAKVQE